MQNVKAGQRWASLAEPDLGLATVLRVDGRFVQVVFPGTSEVRQYAKNSAPLVRASFAAGDLIRVNQTDWRVSAVHEDDGLFHYECHQPENRTIAEGELDPEQPMGQAQSRLLAGRIDPPALYALRSRTLKRMSRMRAHPAWGLLSARVDPLAHQFRVAELAHTRRPVRLLLADEVGLGKTIEAGMILAQHLASGISQRALIIVPESLQYQWFIELHRRFNIQAALFDAERFASIQDGNPFMSETCIIASQAWLVEDIVAQEALLEAPFDLLLVDEAHHLTWTPEQVSPDYALVEQLAHNIEHVLLLTATPEQLGLEGHFARLRLLDPERHDDLEAHKKEVASYAVLGEVLSRLESGKALTQAQHKQLDQWMDDASTRWEQAQNDPEAREQFVQDLIDCHGIGRVMIRHRHEQMGGFSERTMSLHVLANATDTDEASNEGGDEASQTAEWSREPRMAWLCDLLSTLPATQKVVVMVDSMNAVNRMDAVLRHHSDCAVAKFHEGMSLLQRDRAAAWFGEVDGAQVLISSPEGAEGRNFQVAGRLVLFDVPLHPDQLEQRIGRLDRIGQTQQIHVDVPVLAHSAQHRNARWLHEGLNAFAQATPAGVVMMQRFYERLHTISAEHDWDETAFASLIDETQQAHTQALDEVRQGRDALLERAYASLQEPALLQALQKEDEDAAEHEAVMAELLTHFGVHHEPLDEQRFTLNGTYASIEGLPGLSDEPRLATTHRATALRRDDVLFLADDHPLILNAQDALIGSESGNATALIEPSLPRQTMLLDAQYVLKTMAPPQLAVQRFMPGAVLQAVIDTKLNHHKQYSPSEEANQLAERLQMDLTKLRKLLLRVLPPMSEAASKHIETKAQAWRAKALQAAADFYEPELARLKQLLSMNHAVRAEHVDALSLEYRAVQKALKQAQPRLDAMRLVLSADLANRA